MDNYYDERSHIDKALVNITAVFTGFKDARLNVTSTKSLVVRPNKLARLH